MTKVAFRNFIGNIFKKLGLKAVILLILHTNFWRNYLHNFFVFLIKLPLRLKYYRLIRINRFVPTRHLIALNIMQKLIKIYEPLGIKFFLYQGQLLGSIRQESFAGRPSDIDFGLIDEHFDLFFKNLNLIEENFNTYPINIVFDKKKFKITDPNFSGIQKHIEVWAKNDATTFYRFGDTSASIQMRFDSFLHESDGTLVDIKFFTLKDFNNQKYWVNLPSKSSTENVLPRERFPENDLINLKKSKLYGFDFWCPDNPERFLSNFYGKDWKIPNKKQFAWNKKFL